MSEEQETATTDVEQPATANDGSGESGPAESAQNSGEQAGSEQSGQKKKSRKQTSARKTRSVELTLTVTGTAEGEWQAELVHGGKRILQGVEIPASAVSRAASELNSEISDTIESVLSEARQQHEARLAELEAELQRVRKTLADLEG